MGREQRLKLIESIEKERTSKVITYLTSTRKNFEVQMAMDAVRRIFDHLEAGSGAENLDLFLHSNGGDGTVPWRLATLMRERAKKFSVLVPFKAFSAATLTALGAHEIVMHPMGMLGPTDATVGNAFNPRDKLTNGRLGISVEDVTAYIALIKEDVGIHHEDELVKAFNHLSRKVHPLALGNVKRHISQSRMMANKLLSLHMDRTKDTHKIEEIVDNLTSKLYFHGHPINRQEAREHVGLTTVVDPPQKVEKLMWRLYLDYEEEMKLEQPYDMGSQFISEHPSLAPGASKTTNPQKAKLVCIESRMRADHYEMEYEIYGERPATGPGIGVTTVTLNQGWTTG